MGSKATAQELGRLAKVQNRLFDFVDQGKRPAQEMIDGVQALIDGRSVVRPARPKFTSLGEQLRSVIVWLNDDYDEGRFNYAAEQADRFAGEPRMHEGLTLCWTLGTLRETLERKLELARGTYGDELQVSDRLEGLRTLATDPSTSFIPHNLWWQEIDLTANRDVLPVLAGPSVAGLEIFDVLLQHPGYIHQLDGVTFPHLNAVGLRCKLPGGHEYWMPRIVKAGKSIRVEMSWVSNNSPHYASPTLV